MTTLAAWLLPVLIALETGGYLVSGILTAAAALIVVVLMLASSEDDRGP